MRIVVSHPPPLPSRPLQARKDLRLISRVEAVDCLLLPGEDVDDLIAREINASLQEYVRREYSRTIDLRHAGLVLIGEGELQDMVVGTAVHAA
jgi:hypothetical protein